MTWIPRIMAIVPSKVGFAHAVLEGPERLVAFGLANAADTTKPAMKLRLQEAFTRFKPQVVVLEDLINSPRGHGAKRQDDLIEHVARKSGIEIVGISRASMKEHFAAAGVKPTIREISVACARLFPELEPRLPPRREAWAGSDRRSTIFVAVALGLVTPT